jgi:hypothetical protein
MTTSLTLESVHFTVEADQSASFLAKRDAMIACVRELDGFVRGELIEMQDGTWLDLVLWTSPEAAAAVAATFGDHAPIADWAQHIGAIVTMAHGTVVHASH